MLFLRPPIKIPDQVRNTKTPERVEAYPAGTRVPAYVHVPITCTIFYLITLYLSTTIKWSTNTI